MTSDLDGTRVYYGAGVDWQATDNLRLYMQVEREHGEHFTRRIQRIRRVEVDIPGRKRARRTKNDVPAFYYGNPLYEVRSSIIVGWLSVASLCLSSDGNTFGKLPEVWRVLLASQTVPRFHWKREYRGSTNLYQMKKTLTDFSVMV